MTVYIIYTVLSLFSVYMIKRLRNKYTPKFNVHEQKFYDPKICLKFVRYWFFLVASVTSCGETASAVLSHALLTRLNIFLANFSD